MSSPRVGAAGLPGWPQEANRTNGPAKLVGSRLLEECFAGFICCTVQRCLAWAARGMGRQTSRCGAKTWQRQVRACSRNSAEAAVTQNPM